MQIRSRSRQLPSRHGGFTLVEVMVAIGIFAMLGFACYRVMSGLADARDRISSRTDSLRSLSRAVRMVDADLRQLIGRTVLDEEGEKLSAFSAGSGVGGTDDLEGVFMEFSRQGIRNPLMARRADVLRISYGFEESISQKDAERWGVAHEKNNDQAGYLYRYVWPVLDRGRDVQPQKQLLLPNVQSISSRFLDADGEWQEEWPPSSGVGFSFELGSNNNATAELPYAIEVKIDTVDFGVIDRVYVFRQLSDKASAR